ncbi:MAG: hypothetical protein H0W08_10440 [Acidobacteria bacterium]|nr:hypothetical protein [Acidobacteriota bacterium]
MDREAQDKLLAGAGVVAGIVGLIVFFGKRWKRAPRELFADITVDENGMDVSYRPETIEDASISRRDFVIWRVKNLSEERVTVCVKGFKTVDNNTCEDPLDDVDHDRGKCRNVPDEGSRDIRSQVKKSARKGTYKYSIFVNDREAVDPRLSIVD